MNFWLFVIFSFILGTIVGSFLNVCIYRLPREISLWNPHRSFCPNCQNSLKWKELIPVLSWIMLRGRCRRCRTWISFQYPLVEVITGILFLVLWIFIGFPQAVGIWVLGSLLIVATFIDLQTLIIPNVVTVGGILAGFVLSLIMPSALGWESASVGISRAVAGAAAGYLILWGVLEIGKWCFGKICFRWDSPQEFRFCHEGENIWFECGGQIWTGEEMFVRKKDELIIETIFWKTTNGLEGNGKIRLREGHFVSTQGEMRHNDASAATIQEISGKATSVVIPREAMGGGDVKLLAAIGAFIGAPGVLFTLLSASLLGTFVGLWFLLRGFRGGTPIPFGPFLAIGALAWVLGGQTLWNVYFSRLY